MIIINKKELRARKRALCKYRNKRTKLDGFVFDSRIESHRYLKLKAMQQRGEIKDLQCHPKFIFPPGFAYKADFSYREVKSYAQNDQLIVEDVKSEVTRRLPTYILKIKCLHFFYPAVEFREVVL